MDSRLIFPKIVKAVYRLSPIKKGLIRFGSIGWKNNFASSNERIPVTVKMGDPPYIIDLDLREIIQYKAYKRSNPRPQFHTFSVACNICTIAQQTEHRLHRRAVAVSLPPPPDIPTLQSESPLYLSTTNRGI